LSTSKNCTLSYWLPGTDDAITRRTLPCIARPAGYDIPTSTKDPDTTQAKLTNAQISFGHLVVREFPRSFHGYDRAAVRKHLEHIATWLSLSGLDNLVRERFNEQDPLGRRLRAQAETEAQQIRADAPREEDHHRQLRAQAERDAEQVRADARRDAERHREEARRALDSARQDAEEIRARARREADRLLADARAQAAAERRSPLSRFLSRGTPDR